MEGWTTPKQVSAAMLIMAFASFPQILSVTRSEWSQSLDIAIACFSIGMPLSTGYFLREAKMESPHGDWWRNLRDAGWVLSVVINDLRRSCDVSSSWPAQRDLFRTRGDLAVLLILVGAHADGEWGTGKG